VSAPVAAPRGDSPGWEPLAAVRDTGWQGPTRIRHTLPATRLQALGSTAWSAPGTPRRTAGTPVSCQGPMPWISSACGLPWRCSV